MSYFRPAVASVLVIVAVSGSARAQSTHIINEASIDGGVTWASSVQAAPGSRVDVRIRVALVGATATGLGGITFQPTLSNWHPESGDARVPFTFPGLSSDFGGGHYGEPLTQSSYQGSHVADNPGNTGRVYPFGFAGMTPNSSGIPTSFNDPGNTLRFAGSKNTSTTQNLAWGIGVSQPTWSGHPEWFNTSPAPVVFKYAVTLSGDQDLRSLTATVPFENISPGTVNAVWWYSPYFRAAVTPETIFPATIIVPSAPAYLALLACGVAMQRRRRRATR